MIEVVGASKSMTKHQMERVMGVNPLEWLYGQCLEELGEIPDAATITVRIEYLEAK